MSLVAYEDSDCESDEEDFVAADVKKPSTDSIQEGPRVVDGKRFLTLPQPKSNVEVSNGYDSVDKEKLDVQPKKLIENHSNTQEKREERPLFPTLPKPKGGGKVKIIIPSLNEVFIIKFVISCLV